VPRKPVSALEYAYRLLSYRQRSVAELRRRLRMKGYEEAEYDEVVERLLEFRLLDDTSFARSLRLRAEEQKYLGRAGARGLLRRMGISPSDADEALEDYEELDVARRLVRKKRRTAGLSDDAASRRRLMGYLQRRGYSAATVRKVLDSEEEDE
jgi:regulatory protein